jgi:hypothetical protein
MGCQIADGQTTTTDAHSSVPGRLGQSGRSTDDRPTAEACDDLPMPQPFPVDVQPDALDRISAVGTGAATMLAASAVLDLLATPDR